MSEHGATRCTKCGVLSEPKFSVDLYTFKGDGIAWGYRLNPWDQPKPHGPFRLKYDAIKTADNQFERRAAREVLPKPTTKEST